MQVDALTGYDGMLALLEAYRDASQEFELSVSVGIAIVGGSPGRCLLLTIGRTTAALSVHETQWMANALINQSGGLGSLSDDLQRFGRTLLEVLAEAPGVHGVH